MKGPPLHLVVFSTLLFTVILVVWLGVAGPLLGDVAGQGLYSVLKDFQGFIAASVALMAAALAYANTTRSIKSSEGLEQARRNAKKHSLRATLPLVLTEIHDYSAHNLDGLIDLHSALDANGALIHAKSPLVVAGVPTAGINALSGFIEYATAEESVFLKRIIQRIQIHHSRVASLASSMKLDPSAVITRHWIEANILDAAGIIALSDAVYEYGRFRSGNTRLAD